MKFWKKEEFKMIAVVIAIFALFYAGITMCINDISTQVEKAGGFKGIAVSIGKEIKDVSEEIKKDD